MIKQPILIEHIKKMTDSRGAFYESFKKSVFLEKYDINCNFIQDNHSISIKNTIRGLHYQWDNPMDKLIRVSSGSILDVVVDIKKDSPNFGKIYYFHLNDENNKQLFVPHYYAHGFICLSEVAHVQYKCSAEYNKNGESGINPFDNTLKIDWGISLEDSIISEKDKTSKSFEEYKLMPKF